MLFNTDVDVVVPSKIIEKIGYGLRDALLNEILKTDISSRDIHQIECLMKEVIDHYVFINGDTYKNISIDKDDISKIAHELSFGRRINAVKLFKESTGMPLLDAKKIIDEFDPTMHIALEFMITFS